MTGKPCKDCGRILPLGEFPAYLRRGQTSFQPRCRKCHRKYDKRNYAARASYQPWHERRLAQVRALDEEIKADPERMEQRRRQKRAYERKRRREGVMVLPVEPFARWLDEQMADLERDYPVGGARAALTARTGVNERRLFSLLGRHQENVALDLVDAALCRAGVHLSEVYPELYEAVA